MSKVKIANHHTGDFEFPMSEGDILHGHVCLVAGRVTEVDSGDWAKIKEKSIVQHWLKVEKISVVKSTGQVPTNNLELVDLTIPPELTRPEEEGKLKGVSAKVINKRLEISSSEVPLENQTSAPVSKKRGRGKAKN